jgi:hypothetical protein
LLLEEAARWAGSHRWLELRLFEILGGWVASTEDTEAKLVFDRHSQHHAWRADQWWDRLPVLADVDRQALVAAPSPQMAAATDELAGVQGTVPRLAGGYRFAVPRLVAAYHAHRLRTCAASDGAARRTLDIVLPDVSADWRHGEVLLQELLTDESLAQLAATTVARLEATLLGSRR